MQGSSRWDQLIDIIAKRGDVLNLLVVEDEGAIREGVREYLTEQGFHVFDAEDGVEALWSIWKRVDWFNLTRYYDASKKWFWSVRRGT